MFYESDASTGNGLGLAILGAVKSKIGRWQVQSGDDWIDISAEPKILIPEGLITEFTHRGPLPVTSYMKKLACKFDDESASLTSPNEAMCWNEVCVVTMDTLRQNSPKGIHLNNGPLEAMSNDRINLQPRLRSYFWEKWNISLPLLRHELYLIPH